MDVVYRDQAPTHNHYGDRCFFSALTPWGVKLREGGYIRRILDFQGNEEDRLGLEREIRDDPHLHRVIKSDLIRNLRER
jgi:hypothetical protein